MNAVSGSVSGPASGVDWPEIFGRYGFDTPDGVGNYGAYMPQIRLILEIEGLGFDAVERGLEAGVLEERTREVESVPGSGQYTERTIAYRCPEVENQ